MAQQVRTFFITIPAGTPKASPQETDMDFGDFDVQSVQFVVPFGSQGVMGFVFALAHQPIIPFGTGEWLVSNNENTIWDLRGYPTSGAWSLIAYNTGKFPHTIQVRFLLNLIPRQSSPSLTPIPSGVLAGP